MSRDWTKAELDEDLTAYVDGELNELDRKRFEERLKAEPELAAMEKLLRSTVKQVSALPMPAVSQQLRRNVLNRIDEPATVAERLRAWLSGWKVVPAVGLAAAAAITFVVVTRNRPDKFIPDPEQIELAQNFEVLENMDVLGLDSPDDLEIVARLDELEVKP